MILGRGGGGPLEDENQTLGGQKSSDIIYGWSPRWFHHTFFSSVLFSTGNYMPIYIRQFLKFDFLTIIFLSLSVFPRISVSGSVGFWYHGNGREARHLFRDFEQKSDSCNIAGLGCQPDRVPSRGYRGGPGKWDRNPRKSLFWGHDQKIDYTYWSLFDIPSWNSYYWSRGGFRWICLRGDQLPHFQGMYLYVLSIKSVKL